MTMALLSQSKMYSTQCYTSILPKSMPASLKHKNSCESPKICQIKLPVWLVAQIFFYKIKFADAILNLPWPFNQPHLICPCPDRQGERTVCMHSLLRHTNNMPCGKCCPQDLYWPVHNPSGNAKGNHRQSLIFLLRCILTSCC